MPLDELTEYEYNILQTLIASLPKNASFIGVGKGAPNGIARPTLAYFRVDAYTEFSVDISDYEFW
jgi:hypothetical protein